MTQLFTNPVYLGKIVHGEDNYVEKAHAALIDERTWTLAQRSGPRTSRNGSIAGKGVLLSLIRCAGCGHPLTQFASGSRGRASPTTPAAVACFRRLSGTRLRRSQ